MTISRAVRKAISRWLIGALLFAQLAVAGYACPVLPGVGWTTAERNSMVMADESASGAAVAAAPTGVSRPCDQMDQDAANLCLEHCRHGQQTADTVPVQVVLAGIPTLLYSIPLALSSLVGPGRPASIFDACVGAAPPPPHAILHCVFRI